MWTCNKFKVWITIYLLLARLRQNILQVFIEVLKYSLCNEILTKEWQRPGHVIIFSLKCAFWVVQASRMRKKIELKYAIFEGVFFSCFHGQKIFYLILHCNVRTKKLLRLNVRYFFKMWLINQSYTSKDQSQKFSQKNIENWRSPENDFCLVFWFLVFGYWVVQKKKCFFSMKNTKEVHMR